MTGCAANVANKHQTTFGCGFAAGFNPLSETCCDRVLHAAIELLRLEDLYAQVSPAKTWKLLNYLNII